MKWLKFKEKDYWRAIILYGLNTATYKIALGQSLFNFVNNNKTIVTIEELANEFFELYRDRVKRGMPQLNLPNRLTVMERIINEFNLGKIDKTKVIEKISRNAFNDVIPRFHTVNKQQIDIQFYEFTGNKLILTDNAFKVLSQGNKSEINEELSSRWDLLEAAFMIKRENFELVNDKRQIYIEKGYERTNITKNIPVLNGYQNGICFYCGEKMDKGDIHVDHVIPRQVVNHDEIWNLVLAHGFCNEQKSDALPNKYYIEKLIERNEHFIASNHPIKNKLIKQIGNSSKERRKTVYKVYDDAKFILGDKYTWEGIRGYNPRTDEFYKTFIRKVIIK